MTSRLPALLLVAAILLSFSLTSAATVKMMGAGNVTCKEWLQLRTSTEYFSAGNSVFSHQLPGILAKIYSPAKKQMSCLKPSMNFVQICRTKLSQMRW
jgi:hypothetical protein